jgi:hypothetical protein
MVVVAHGAGIVLGSKKPYIPFCNGMIQDIGEVM